MNAIEFGDAGHEIDAAGKIAVLLERIEKNSYSDHSAAIERVLTEHFFNQRQRAVRDYFLLKEAPQHQHKAALDADDVQWMRLGELCGKMIISYDRPLDQLREKGYKQHETERIAFCSIFPVVNIQQITH